MAITSFTKNFSIPKENSLKSFTSKRRSLSHYQKELKNIFGR